MATQITEVQKLVKFLTKQPDLKKFKADEGEKFCKEHMITSGQLDFLLAVAAANKIKEKNIPL